jgi:hypothetical protein
MRGSHTPIPAVVAATVLLVAVGGATLGQSPSSAPSTAPLTSPGAEVSPAAGGPAAPVALGPIEWKIVTKGKDFTADPAVYGVGQLSDGRLVVVGSVGADPTQAKGAAWVSDGGSKWTRLKGLKAPKGSSIFATANLGTTAVAVGVGSDGGLVWTSADGSDWAAGEPISGAIYSLATNPAGLVAVGVEGGAPTSWTTTDGLSWQSVVLAPAGVALHVMVGPDGTHVATGSVSDAAGLETPVVWTSTDGSTWVQSTLDGLLPGQWSNPSAAHGPAGFVVTFSAQGQAGSIGHVWSSPDGTTWTESLVDQDGALTGAGSVGTEALLIGRGKVLRSPDGVTWIPTDEKDFAGWTVRDVMTLEDGRLFAAGDAFQGMGSAMATWTGTAEPLS